MIARVLILCFVLRVVHTQRREACSFDDGCVVRVPDFWTKVGVVNFNFSGLSETNPDRLSDYQWGLGDVPGEVNVISIQSVERTTSYFREYNIATLDGQTVDAGGYTFTNQTVYALNLTLTSYLANGGKYTVTVLYNGVDGLQRNATSNEVQVVTTAPVQRPGGLVYPTQDCQNEDTVEDSHNLWVCWDDFTITVVPVTVYYVQIFEAVGADSSNDSIPVGRQYRYPNSSESPDLERRVSGDQISVQLHSLELRVGQRYFIRVSAENQAGLIGTSSGVLFLVTRSTRLSSLGTALVVAGSIVASVVLTAALVYWFMQKSRLQKRRMKKQRREKQRHLKTLMYSLVTEPNEEGKLPADVMMESKDVCLVVTDLENSTAQAEKDPVAFTKIQNIHDTIIREGIQKNSGYEISTEGDAFAIAFLHVHTAVVFAMDTQYRLTDTMWPKEVLKLPSCGPEYDKDGEILRIGPRIRIGIHYADSHTIVKRLHVLTKLRQYSGPGYNLALEVSDAAHGGQVLLTETAWQKLSTNMAAANFPTVAQIGLYKFDHWQANIWVYEVTQLLGRKAYSPKKPLRKHNAVESGWGYNIVKPPAPRDNRFLTFTYCRVDTKAAGTKALHPPPFQGTYGRMQSIAATVKNKLSRQHHKEQQCRELEMRAISFKTMQRPHIPVGRHSVRQTETTLSEVVQNLLFDHIAICAMQFGGYVSLVQKDQGLFGVVFGTVLDALRFAHAAQVRLLYTEWQMGDKELGRLFGPTEFTPDGRLLFNGPRVAMAIHETGNFVAERVDLSSLGQRDSEMSYSGAGIDLAMDLVEAAQGGQVMLSETAWASVQDRLPGSTQTVSLGTHLLTEDSAEPMLLMENMPTMLHLRTFERPRVFRYMEPGYRDSPNPDFPVAIVFTKVHKPNIVRLAEKGSHSLDEVNIVRVLTQFNVAVMKVSRVIRQMLQVFDGYECKEPEPGKLTLAFHSSEAAVRWACAVTKELMEAAWPAVLGEWPETKEEFVRVAEGEEQLLWNGPRVSMGMTYGKPQYRKPLNTGRADYYGSTANLAARICQQAHPGQILVEGGGGFTQKLHWETSLQDMYSAVLPVDTDPSGLVTEEDIELKFLGFYMLKGITQPKMVLQANPKSLSKRYFLQLNAPLIADAPKNVRPTRPSQHSFSAGSSDSPFPSYNSSTWHSLARKGSSLASTLHPFDIFRRNRSTRDEQGGQPGDHRISIDEGDELEVVRPEPGRKSPWGSFAQQLATRVHTANTLSRLSAQRQSKGSGSASQSPFRKVISGSSTLASDHIPERLGSAESDLQVVRRVLSAADQSEQPSAAHSFSSRGGQSFDDRCTSTSSMPGAQRSSIPGPSSARTRHEDAHLPPRFPSVVSSPPAYFDRDDDENGKEYAEQLAQSFARSGALSRASIDTRRGSLQRADTPPPAHFQSIVSLPAHSNWSRLSGASQPPTSQSARSSGHRNNLAVLEASRELEASSSASEFPREQAPRSAEQMAAGVPAQSPFITSPNGPDLAAFSSSYELGSIGPSKQTSLPIQNPESFQRESSELRRMSTSQSEDMAPYALSFSSAGGDGHNMLRQSLEDAASVDSPRGSTASTPRMRSQKHLQSSHTRQRHAILDVMHRRSVAQHGLLDGDRQLSFTPDQSHRGEISTVPEEPDGPQEDQK